MIRPGTTPTHTFELPIDETLCDVIWITYAQDDDEVFTIDKSRLKFEGRLASVKLTQEETLKFDREKLVAIQMRILTTGGDALGSDVVQTSVGRLLKEEVIG